MMYNIKVQYFSLVPYGYIVSDSSKSTTFGSDIAHTTISNSDVCEDGRPTGYNVNFVPEYNLY